MRYCDIKTLEEALGDMWGFVCREGRQDQVNKAWRYAKEHDAPAATIEATVNGYALQEYVQPGLPQTALILKIDIGYEFHIEPGADAFDVLHRHHFYQFIHAMGVGLITTDEPPSGSKLAAIVKPGEWHDFRGKASDWFNFCKDLKWPILFMQGFDEGVVAQAAWWLLKDGKAALDVEEWFVDYCRMHGGDASVLFDGGFKAPVHHHAIPQFMKSSNLVEYLVQRRSIPGLGTPIDPGKGELVPDFKDPDSGRPFSEVEALVDGDEYKPPRQEWPPPKTTKTRDRAFRDNWPQGELRGIPKVAKYIGRPESTMRDAIKAGEIQCEVIDGIQKRKNYLLHGRKHYSFTQDQYEEAKRYFDKKDRNRALRLLIIREYKKKRGVGEDTARQWVYRKMKENPSLTLEALKSLVDKMKKGKGPKKKAAKQGSGK